MNDSEESDYVLRGAGTTWTLLGEREQPGPKLGPMLPSHSKCWFRWLHCSPGKHLSTISLVPSLWLDLEVHRSFAADRVFGLSRYLWDQGQWVQHSSSGQASVAAWRRLPLFCVAALIPGYQQPLLSITRLDKGRMPPARHGGSTAPYGHNGASLQ